MVYMKKLEEVVFTERELKIFKEIQQFAVKYQTKRLYYLAQEQGERIVKRVI